MRTSSLCHNRKKPERMTEMDQRKVLSSRKSSEDLTNADASSESSSTPATPPHGEQDIEKAGTSKHGNGDPNDVPDGGWAAWLVVLGTWCTSFCSFGWLNSIGVFQEYYQGTLLHGYSASTVAWIPSLQVFFMMGTGPFVGLIYDRYGHRWLLLIGSVMHVFGIMMASLGKTYYQILLAQGLCSAIGVSMIFTPSVNCMGGWFSKNRGAAFGVAFTGSSLGGVIFPIMVTHLIPEVGFPWAMRSCAFMILGLLTIANLTVKERNPPRPYKITAAQLAKPFTEFNFVFAMAGFFFFTFGLFIPINYLPQQAISAGMSAGLADYLIPILNSASLFGRLSAGFSGDRVGSYNIFIIVCYLSAIWILGLWLPDSSNAALIAFAILFGFCSGAYVSLMVPLVIAVSPMQEIGFRVGIFTFVAAIGGLVTNPIAGAMIPDGWSNVKIFAGVLCVAGPTFALITRVHVTGLKLFARF